ncbi:transposase, partial [Methanobrevibacter sp.]|uniref:transposase n=1 Tax=Methanobrevibacter sp. TaxID=66852 RepID=UPI00388D8ED7
TKDTIYAELKKERYSDVKTIRKIINLIFTPCIIDIVKELEKDFKDQGPRHYPRLLLLGIVLYCFSHKMYKYTDIANECRKNRFLRIFTRGAEPCENTFRNFLNESDTESMRKIFLYTLVRYNDVDLLKFLHYFIDSTDAIVRGSKYYKIYKIELEAMKLMKKHNLLHNPQKPKQIKRSIDKLLKIREEHMMEENIVELIDMIIPRIQIYNYKMYKHIDEFEQAIKNSNKDFVCITYPNAPLIPTKKGNWDFAKNLQVAVTDDNIIIGSIFINNPDDSKALPQILPELKKNFEILWELQKKYGTRNNEKEIKNMLKKAMVVCDSGYASEENITYICENDIRSLIMPKITSIYINNKMKSFDEKLEELSSEIEILDEENTEIETTRKKDMSRIWDGYNCKFNRPVMFTEKTPIPDEIEKGLPKRATKANYKYKALDCSGCPYRDVCKHKSFTEKISPYIYESMNKFTQKFYQELYMQRFHKSESINGYFKGINGILHLLGTNDKAITNEMHLRNTIYNTIHFVSISGTVD